MTLTAEWSNESKTQVIVRTTYGIVTNEVQEDRGHVASFWAQLGRLLAQHPEHAEGAARDNYERYCRSAGGVSAVSGEPLPAWDEQDERIRGHWLATVTG